jgi:tetratricopeptide (TPR) repeat protein
MTMTEPIETVFELRALLSADDDGPAERLDAAGAARLVEGAVEQAWMQQPARLRGKRLAWGLAAALVLTGSAAAMYSALRGQDQAAVVPARNVAPEPASAAASSEPVLAPAPAIAPAQPEPAVTPAKPSARELPTRSQGDAKAVEDLLQRANRLRGEAQYRAAERVYLRVATTSPNGAAAYTARTAAASLRLEQLGDPKGALRLYEEALHASPQGALAPEIHEGMAHAYRALGRRADERRALQALLAAQAAGPATERARKRLQVLDATP